MDTNKNSIFIEKANKMHKNKYDYSKINYINNHIKICIICPKHGKFYQTPANHLQGCGCPECAKNSKLTIEKFIEKANKVHKNKYNYSKVTYKNSRTKICIVCPIHGEFSQSPSAHLQGHGCPKCGKENLSKKLSQGNSGMGKIFINKANKIHKNKYDYSKVKYVNSKKKINIICPEHGEFWQTPNDHLSGKGCPKCAKIRLSLIRTSTNEKFKQKAKKIHNEKYDYSKVNYINNKTKVCIICPVHGEFWQKPIHHLQGCGCPKCNMSHLERETMKLLDKYNIIYETQKRFNWLRANKNFMSLDFFLPLYNIAIECQGIQHYKAQGFFTESKIKRTQQNDKLKKELCSKHNIKIYYIKYNDIISEKIDKIVQEYQIDILALKNI